MEAIARLEEEELSKKVENLKAKIEETDQLIHDLYLKKSKLVDTVNELTGKSSKRVVASNKWRGKNLESTDFEWSSEIQKAMKDTFKIENFRPSQLLAINAVMSGQDCILLMPTGAGKSLCYQLPAKILKGITLVVSPLESLMEDQVMSLQNVDLPATYLSTSVSLSQISETLKAMSDKNCPLKLIYVTPERLAKIGTFVSALQKAYENGIFSLLAIDEVHCCSQLGHDFRTDYKLLGIMKRHFPNVPILGVTATASSEILEDVKQILGLEGCLTIKVPFNRPNLRYQVISKPSKPEDAFSQLLSFLQGRFKGCCGIIYCFNVIEADQIASNLCANGIKAASYHTHLYSKDRSLVHKEWASNKIQVVTATRTFGMGINKPDVRFVIHYTMPWSVEGYYQESGRAGRDGSFAECILFCDVCDMFKLSTTQVSGPKTLKKLYRMVEYCVDLTRCRSFIIAQQFKEQWNRNMCNKMCDNCEVNLSYGTVKDMTEQCLYMFAIITHCTSMNYRVTPREFVNMCIGKLPENFVPLQYHISRLLDQESYEYLLALLIIRGYLKESFRIIPFQSISYIEIDDSYRNVSLSSMKLSFMMPLKEKVTDDCNLDSSNILVEDVAKKTDSAFHGFQHTSKRQKTTMPEASITKSKPTKTSCIRKMPTCTVTSSLQQDVDTAQELICIDDSSGKEVSFISSMKNVRAVSSSDSD